MRVMTWNVWGRFGEDWKRRERAVAATVAEARPDVLALQETWSTPTTTQAEVLAAELGMHAVFSRSRMPVDPDPEVELGLAVLSRWPVGGTERVPLPPEGGDTVALTVTVEHPRGPLWFTTTCLDWEEDHGPQRLSQAAALRAWLEDPGMDGDLPVVVAGDLNSPPDTPEMDALRAALTDCWQAARDDDAGHTYSAANPYLGTGEWLENSRIDYVLARRGARGHSLDVRDAFRAGLPGEQDPTPSDHYAIVADLDP